jgi:sec-independent protein translocase protein TatA
MSLGWPELIIIFVILVLLFGVGRIARIGSELGRGVHNFREGLGEKDDSKKDNK